MNGKKSIKIIDDLKRDSIPSTVFFDSLPFGVCFYTFDGEEFQREKFEFDSGNQEFFHCIGYEREALRDKKYYFDDFIHKPDYKSFLDAIEDAVKEPESIQEIDVGIQQTDGTLRYVSGRMQLVHNWGHKYCICCVIVNVDHYVNENQDLSERIEESNRETSRLSNIIEMLPSGMAVLRGDSECKITMINKEFFRPIGFLPEEVMNGNREIYHFCYPDDWKLLEQMQKECLEKKQTVEKEVRFCERRGQIHWLLVRICLYSYKDCIPYFLVASWDINDRKKIEDEVRLQTERNKLLEELTNEIPLDYNVEEQRFRITDSIKKKYLFPMNEIGLREYGEMVHGDDREKFYRIFQEASSKEIDGIIEYRVLLKAKEQTRRYVWHRTRYKSIVGSSGKVIRIIGRVYNIDKEKRIHNQLWEQTRRDPMTQLLNKQALQEEVAEFLEERPQGMHAFMIIDIDNFKKINDTFGHIFGDTIIREISEKIKEQFRDLDIVGRVGGDEFVVCMKYTTVEHAKEKAKSLCESVRKKYASNQSERTVSCSVGISFFGQDGNDYETLFAKADMAMYRAKVSGKNGYKVADKREHLKKVMAVKEEVEEDYQIANNHDKEFLEYSFELLSKAKDIDGSINILLERIGKHYNLNLVTIHERRGSEEILYMTNCWVSKAAYMKTDIAEKKLVLWKEQRKSGRLLISNCNDKSVPREDKEIFREFGAQAYAQFAYGNLEKPEGYVTFCDCEEAREWTGFEEHTFLELVRLISVFLAIRAQREQTDYEIQCLQDQDPLTGLYNLKTFKWKAEQILRSADDEAVYAIICADVSGFSYINENFGHSEGDQVLERIASYIEKIPETVLSCRRYADLFLIVTKTKSREQCIQGAFEKNTDFQKFMKKRYPNGNIYESIGIFFWDKESFDIEECIENANIARKVTKKDHEFWLKIYSNSLKDEKNRERIIAASFYSALNNDEFEIYLQPKFLLDEREVYGAEALARWKRLDGRYHSPNDFIPVLEKLGYVNDLDFYVFEQTVKCLKKWNEDGKEGLIISTNFSGKHFRDLHDDFVERICEITERYGVDNSQLEIEITESVAVKELNHLQQILIKLRERGFRIAIDDFGTGYSSLNILFDIPVDVIKIDKSFLNTENFQKRKQLIIYIGEMVQLAEEEIIFEGVEKEEQIEFLKECGYKFGQGYIFDRPIRVFDFEQKYLY